MPEIIIKVFQVLNGDCISIQYDLNSGEKFTIFIDAGFVSTYQRTLRQAALELQRQGHKIDIFVITHVDRDHIGGIKPFFAEFGDTDLVTKYWFNYGGKPFELSPAESQIGFSQGIDFRDNLLATGKDYVSEIVAGMDFSIPGGQIRILSPTREELRLFQEKWKDEEQMDNDNLISAANDGQTQSSEELIKNTFIEDNTWTNASSISFILEIGNCRTLFTADAHPSTISNSLRNLGATFESPMHFDFVKLSHHGAKGNTSPEFVNLIDCQNFLISSNGTNAHRHPHKESLARIVLKENRDRTKPLNFFFNHETDPIKALFPPEELQSENIILHFPQKKMNALSLNFSF